MRIKWRFLFVGIVVFMLVVSYKILEPEFSKNRDVYEIEINERLINLEPDTVEVDGVVHVVKKDSEITQVVKSMSDRFIPLYSYQLNESPWDVAAKWANPRTIHPQDPFKLGAILEAMYRGNVTSADVGHKGTQLKLTLVLDGKQKVVFKPAWYPRDHVITGTPYEGRDRHNGEIAGFHLGRILEFRRTPLTIGRKLDIEKDILNKATPRLVKTFFEQDGEQCFYGRCLYCKGPADGVCAQAGKLEGTVILWLPDTWTLVKQKHPWSRTYRPGVEPKWSQRTDWCEVVKKHPAYKDGPLLLDMIDTAIFDYLIGNADRHQFETFEGHKDSMLIMLDNGKSFGNPYHDEQSILAPLYQCCMIRSRTWERLVSLQDGVLSQVMAKVLRYDPLSPILTKPHFEALDRRLAIVLEQVQQCVDRVGIEAIVVDHIDGDEGGDG